MKTIQTKLLEQFNKVKDKMDALNKHVHEVVLSDSYFIDKQEQINNAIDAVLATIDGKMLDKAVLGKLRFKLPQVKLVGNWNAADKVISMEIAAGIIVQYLIDNEIVKTELKVTNVTIDGKKTYISERFILHENTVEPKYLLKGLHHKPGEVISKRYKVKVGGVQPKYTAEQKDMFRKMASWEFILSDFASKELLMKFYELGKGYKAICAGKSNEDPILMKLRYGRYSDIIMKLKDTKFHFSVWLDARTRLYYDMVLEGLRPQGKLFETLLIDIAEPYVINDEGYRELVHIMMVTLKGRMTINEAVELFESDIFNILDKIYEIDLLQATTQDELGDWLLLKKLAKAYACYKQKRPCHYIFGKDLTNSGLGMAGVGFKATKMMEASNFGGSEDVKDSHSTYAKSFGVERDVIKSLHTGLLHGSTFKSMATDLLHKIREDKYEEYISLHGSDRAEEAFMEDYGYIDEEYIRQSSVDAYGTEVLNINTIASWGGSVINNHATTLKWNTLDGWKSQSVAYMEKVPLKLYIVSTNRTRGYSQWSITCDLPIIITNEGEVVYGKEEGVSVKKRGLYANITHSIDAYVLREVIREAIYHDFPMILKHDDYMAPLNEFPRIRETIRGAMLNIYDSSPYDKALIQIQNNHNQNIDKPRLIIGGGTKADIRNSSNFLMP